jgi:4-hydroxy-tetrahydrodipicolinate reductase
MAKTRVYVSGATGNVGRHLVRALISSADLELVGGWARRDVRDLGEMVGLPRLGIGASSDLRRSLEAAAADVVIDFTAPAVVMDNLRTYAELGLDGVIGTTGFTDDTLGQARAWAAEKRLRWAIIANFCLSMNLALDFAKSVRSYYPYVTIVEKHYAQKADAPSGTSLWLARSLATGEGGAVLSKELLPGVLGGDFQGVRIHSVRVPTPAFHGEHEIIMARQDEALTIKVTDYSSAIFNDTVLTTVRKLGQLPAGSVITSLGELPGGLRA